MLATFLQVSTSKYKMILFDGLHFMQSTGSIHALCTRILSVVTLVCTSKNCVAENEYEVEGGSVSPIITVI
jgi:hypothetical protein